MATLDTMKNVIKQKNAERPDRYFQWGKVYEESNNVEGSGQKSYKKAANITASEVKKRKLITKKKKRQRKKLQKKLFKALLACQINEYIKPRANSNFLSSNRERLLPISSESEKLSLSINGNVTLSNSGADDVIFIEPPSIEVINLDDDDETSRTLGLNKNIAVAIEITSNKEAESDNDVIFIEPPPASTINIEDEMDSSKTKSISENLDVDASILSKANSFGKGLKQMPSENLSTGIAKPMNNVLEKSKEDNVSQLMTPINTHSSIKSPTLVAEVESGNIDVIHKKLNKSSMVFKKNGKKRSRQPSRSDKFSVNSKRKKSSLKKNIKDINAKPKIQVLACQNNNKEKNSVQKRKKTDKKEIKETYLSADLEGFEVIDETFDSDCMSTKNSSTENSEEEETEFVNIPSTSCNNLEQPAGNTLDKDYNAGLSKKKKHCTRCKKTGHKAKNCLRREELTQCYLCGITGHVASQCSTSMCLQCGHPSADQIYCQKCVKFRDQKCYICGMIGHIHSTCPDLWRRYHLTTESGPIVPYEGVSLKPPHHLWCSNCAQSGHLEHTCNFAISPFPRYDPKIHCYVDVYENTTNVQQAENNARSAEIQSFGINQTIQTGFSNSTTTKNTIANYVTTSTGINLTNDQNYLSNINLLTNSNNSTQNPLFNLNRFSINPRFFSQLKQANMPSSGVSRNFSHRNSTSNLWKSSDSRYSAFIPFVSHHNSSLFLPFFVVKPNER